MFEEASVEEPIALVATVVVVAPVAEPKTHSSTCCSRAIVVGKCWTRTICFAPFVVVYGTLVGSAFVVTVGVTVSLLTVAVALSPITGSIEFIATGNTNHTRNTIKEISRLPDHVFNTTVKMGGC